MVDIIKKKYTIFVYFIFGGCKGCRVCDESLPRKENKKKNKEVFNLSSKSDLDIMHEIGNEKWQKNTDYLLDVRFSHSRDIFKQGGQCSSMDYASSLQV